jgi:NTP pyrophosphatase (non-canonical NTP hydrolase)
MSIDFRKYQKISSSTSGAFDELDSVEARTAIAAMGLAGEAGEVVDYLKKVLGHGHPLDQDKVVKELGDVLWYVAEICSVLQLDMEEVAEANVKKLKKRYPDGFSKERSVNRSTYAEY